MAKAARGGMESTGHGDTPQIDMSLPNMADVRTRGSISTKIVSRLLPLIILPLLAIGLVAVSAIALIQSRTSEAVASAEQILTTRVVEDGVNRSADRVARELGDFINELTADVGRVGDRRELGAAIGDGNLRLEEIDARFVINDDQQLRNALAGQPPLVANSFVDALAGEFPVGDTPTEVLLVSNTGVHLSSSAAEGAPRLLPSLYGDTAWFRQAMDEGRSVRPYVPGEDDNAYIEIAERVSVFAEANVVGVIRVRVPMSAVHRLIDRILLDSDEGVNITLFDRDRSVLLADTATTHDPTILYNAQAVMAGGTSLDLELLEPGTVEGSRFLTAARDFAGIGGATDQYDWLLQVQQPLDVATAPLEQIRRVNDDVGSTRSLVSFGVLSLVVLALYIGYRSARRIAARITEPMQRLSEQAQQAATTGIPSIVAAAEQSAEELPELAPFEVDTEDELAVLAGSLNVMQSAAVGLAAGQAQLRRQNVARTFVSLGRRNQNLLNRQLEFIDGLERSETDPDTLENLFRLDHLATRMRRNAENLLVLAGEQTPRRWAKPIALRDVLQAAASEIADFRRVRIGDIDDATVSGSLATDLSHLLAELLENAGTFSPPSTPIDVLGQQTPTHYRLAIMDQGIGMDDAAIAQANHRLAHPVDFADAPSAYIGHFVVGHLARQLDIRVRLARSEPVNIGSGESPTGTIAFIDLPNSLLTSSAPTPISLPARAQREAIGSQAEQPVSVFEPDPADSFERPVEQTEAGFPKREAPVVTDWTTDSVSSAPSADAPPAASADEPPAQQTTSAGFPKRRRGGTTVSDEAVPRQTVAEPAVVDPAAAEPAVSQASDADPTGAESGTTAAGFPKRRGNSAEPAPVVAAPTVEAVEPLPRDAAAVSNSLLSFKAAVQRGRVESQQPLTSAPPQPDVPPAQEDAGDGEQVQSSPHITER